MLGSLLAAVVSGEATAILARVRRAAVAYAVIGVLAVLGLLFLLLAAFVATAMEIGALRAALWFGGGFIALAVVVLVTFRVTERIKARRAAAKRRSDMAAAASAAAVALLPALLASRGRALALVLPAAAGLVWGVWRENSRRRGPPPRPGA